MQIKITTVGSSTGIVLPKEILAKLGVGKGDKLYAIPTSSGVELTPYDPEFSEQIEAAKGIMKENRNILRELAK